MKNGSAYGSFGGHLGTDSRERIPEGHFGSPETALVTNPGFHWSVLRVNCANKRLVQACRSLCGKSYYRKIMALFVGTDETAQARAAKAETKGRHISTYRRIEKPTISFRSSMIIRTTFRGQTALLTMELEDMTGVSFPSKSTMTGTSPSCAGK